MKVIKILILIVIIIIIIIIMQGHFESWENRYNINFSQPNTNIASFTMASFNSPVGAGAWIPYKRGDDDVGWFISYSHS